MFFFGVYCLIFLYFIFYYWIFTHKAYISPFWHKCIDIYSAFFFFFFITPNIIIWKFQGSLIWKQTKKCKVFTIKWHKLTEHWSAISYCKLHYGQSLKTDENLHCEPHFIYIHDFPFSNHNLFLRVSDCFPWKREQVHTLLILTRCQESMETIFFLKSNSI